GVRDADALVAGVDGQRDRRDLTRVVDGLARTGIIGDTCAESAEQGEARQLTHGIRAWIHHDDSAFREWTPVAFARHVPAVSPCERAFQTATSSANPAVSLQADAYAKRVARRFSAPTRPRCSRWCD